MLEVKRQMTLNTLTNHAQERGVENRQGLQTLAACLIVFSFYSEE